MYTPGRCRRFLIPVLLYLPSLALAVNTAAETIQSLGSFFNQKPCARGCFFQGNDGCQYDILADIIGCGETCNSAAPNNCYCRGDLQPIAQSYITSCVSSACTIGDSSIDISSAGSIYSYYCSSLGFPADTPASTTQAVTSIAPEVTSTAQAVTYNAQKSTQATITAYVTVYNSRGVSTGGLVSSTSLLVAVLIVSILNSFDDLDIAGYCFS